MGEKAGSHTIHIFGNRWCATTKPTGPVSISHSTPSHLSLRVREVKGGAVGSVWRATT